MTIGEKIKKIRIFRKMTQKELGLKIGYEEVYAAIKISQYEINYRIPKKTTIFQIAEALNVNPANFIQEPSKSMENIIELLFWLEEEIPESIHLFQNEISLGNCNDLKASTIYGASTKKGKDPVGILFNNEQLNYWVEGWLMKKKKLKSGQIKKEDYFEWKLGWPFQDGYLKK